MDTELRFEDPADAESAVRFWCSRAGTLGVAVTEERAMDSYNQTFECTFHLTSEQALELSKLIATYF